MAMLPSVILFSVYFCMIEIFPNFFEVLPTFSNQCMCTYMCTRLDVCVHICVHFHISFFKQNLEHTVYIVLHLSFLNKALEIVATQFI